LLAEDELLKLGEDIKTNGLKEPVILWSPGSPADYGLSGHPLDSALLLDGRNRLSAMEIVGMCIVGQDGRITTPIPMPQVLYGANIDPASYVISKNIHRRHLTKEQQADLIIRAFEAGTGFAKLMSLEPDGKSKDFRQVSDLAILAKSENRQFPGGHKAARPKIRSKRKRSRKPRSMASASGQWSGRSLRQMGQYLSASLPRKRSSMRQR
jgi:hypothetical protein